MAPSETSELSLEAVRTDGWFERIANDIGSFHALCEVIGERFFAFAVIVGARITALTLDRRNPSQSQVDFVVGASPEGAEPQRLTLADFRRRLVAALLVDDEPEAPRPSDELDLDGLRAHVGVRYLLLAPLYGYSLQSLRAQGGESWLDLQADGEDESVSLAAFRRRLRSLVTDELERSTPSSRNAIDLAKVAEAEVHASRGEWPRVIALLGAWPAPLSVFIRTHEGQMLAPEARALIAKGLGILGSACVELGEIEQAEDVFRVGIQYAQEGSAGADLFLRLGAALLKDERPGEAIGPLRRAITLGSTQIGEIYTLLARAFSARGRHTAAYACLREAMQVGRPASELEAELQAVRDGLGAAFEPLQQALDAAAD